MPTHTVSVASAPQTSVLRSIHLIILIGHHRSVSAIAEMLPHTLRRTMVFNPKNVAKDDLVAIRAAAEESEVSGFENFVLPWFSQDMVRFEKLGEMFGGNMSVFVIKTDANEFARHHPMNSCELQRFKTEVADLEMANHAFTDHIRHTLGSKYCLIRGSRRLAIQVEHIAHHVDVAHGRLRRAVS